MKHQGCIWRGNKRNQKLCDEWNSKSGDPRCWGAGARQVRCVRSGPCWRRYSRVVSLRGAALPQVTLGVAGTGFGGGGVSGSAVRDGLERQCVFHGCTWRGERGSAAGALPRGYHVFHDSLWRSGAIDHVVVGPNDAVETGWSGRVTYEGSGLRVNGVEPSRPPLRQARNSAQALARFLGERLGSAPPCTPVVCFASDTFEPGHLTADNTVVCNASELHSLLVTHAGHLTADECERIVKVMEQKDS